MAIISPQAKIVAEQIINESYEKGFIGASHVYDELNKRGHFLDLSEFKQLLQELVDEGKIKMQEGFATKMN